MSRWMASDGQAVTHSPHSEQTPQSKQSPAEARASASVRGASISAKSRAPLAGTATPASPWRVYSFWRSSTFCLSTSGRRSSMSKPARGSWLSQRSIMCAARRPWPTARVMSDAPVVASPAAKMWGIAVWSVRLSATSVPFALTGRALPKAESSGAMPIATMTVSQGMTNSLPLIGSGRRRPEAIKGSEFVIPCDTVIVAIGMATEASAFGTVVPVNSNGTLVADKHTLQTAVPHIFAAGDATTGASDITRAVGQGRRAAHMIDRWLAGMPLSGFEMDDLLPLVDKQTVLARQKLYSRHGRAGGAAEATNSPENGLNGPFSQAHPARAGWAEIEGPLTEAEARASAGDCLDCGCLLY